MENSNLHPQEVADTVQQTILAAMQANHEMSIQDLADALPDIDKQTIAETLQDGVKRGIYDRVEGSSPATFVLHEDKPVEEPDDDSLFTEEGRFKRHVRSATGLVGRLRTYINEQKAKNETFGKEELVAYSGATPQQVQSAITNLLRTGELVVISPGRRNSPAIYKWREENEPKHVARTVETRERGIVRSLFIYLAETGEHLSADELRAKTGFKWTIEQVNSALNNGFASNLFKKEHWMRPAHWFVEYNKREQWRKDQHVPKSLDELDPLINPQPATEEVEMQQEAASPEVEAAPQKVELPFTGEEFNAFMDIHGNLHMRQAGVSIDLDPDTTYKLAVLLTPRLQFPPKEDK